MLKLCLIHLKIKNWHSWLDRRKCKKIFDKFKINLNIGHKPLDFKNQLTNQPTLKKLFLGIPLDSKFYFLHKYYLDVKDKDTVKCESCVNKIKFTSIMIKKNIIGVQFHPELVKKMDLIFKKLFRNLKMRIIAKLDIKQSDLIKSIRFDGVRKIDSVMNIIDKYQKLEVDEIIILNPTGSLYNTKINQNLLRD